MPRFSESEMGGAAASSKVWVWIVGALLACTVGYGVYVYERPAPSPRHTMRGGMTDSQIRAAADQRLAERKATEKQFRDSIGLTEQQQTQIDDLDKQAMNRRAREDKIKAILSAEQFLKWQDHSQQQGGGFRQGGGRGNPNGTNSGPGGDQNAPPGPPPPGP